MGEGEGRGGASGRRRKEEKNGGEGEKNGGEEEKNGGGRKKEAAGMADKDLLQCVGVCVNRDEK